MKFSYQYCNKIIIKLSYYCNINVVMNISYQYCNKIIMKLSYKCNINVIMKFKYQYCINVKTKLNTVGILISLVDKSCILEQIRGK